MNSDETVASALARFRDENGLGHGEHLKRWWIVRAGEAAFPLPNFAWRKRAIDAHDVHHMLTGYPCTVVGELQIAAWELGAGRYPHWGATLFCLPLAVIGFLWAPQDIWSAWRQGRGQRSLYEPETLRGLLSMPLRQARDLVG